MAVASKPPDHKVLLVSAQDTKAAFHLLKTRADNLLKDELDHCSELHHPLSYFHITIEALGAASLTVSVSLDREFLRHLLTPMQFSCLKLPPLVLSSDLRIRDIFAVTFMSITSVGEYALSTERMFFKTLHTIDNRFFLIDGLSNEYPPTSATALYNEIRTLLSIVPHQNISSPPSAIIVSPNDNLIMGCVYQYYAHGHLGQYLQTISLQSLSRVLDWAVDLVEGVSHMHRNRFLHGDIHFQNIMVADDYTLRLIDFGMAMPIDKQNEFQDVLCVKKVLRYLFSECPREESSRDPVNIRQDLPEPVIQALGENSTLEEMARKIGEGRALAHERSVEGKL